MNTIAKSKLKLVIISATFIAIALIALYFLPVIDSR